MSYYPTEDEIFQFMKENKWKYRRTVAIQLLKIMHDEKLETIHYRGGDLIGAN